MSSSFFKVSPPTATPLLNVESKSANPSLRAFSVVAKTWLFVLNEFDNLVTPLTRVVASMAVMILLAVKSPPPVNPLLPVIVIVLRAFAMTKLYNLFNVSPSATTPSNKASLVAKIKVFTASLVEYFTLSAVVNVESISLLDKDSFRSS